MPLTPTDIRRTADDARQAIGVWMRREDDSPIRVFVTYAALAALAPANVPDLSAALETFDEERERIDAAASQKYDKDGPDEGEHEGQPILVLRSNDF